MTAQSATSFVIGADNTIGGDAAFDTDVFIVGNGPTGATLALLLAQLGVRATAISRYRWLANSPRAHITNQRAAEVFRDAGIESELHRYATSWELMGGTTNVVNSLAGRELARIPAWGGGDRNGEYRLASPCEPMDLPQTYLEPVLVNAAAAQGAVMAFNLEYTGHEQDANGVAVHLRDRVSGANYTCRARYMVGADGGSSLVAEHAGISFSGSRGKSGTVYARFSAELGKWVAHRPGIITLVLQRGVNEGDTGTGVLRCVRAWNDWIAGWGFDPKAGEPDLSEEHALQQIHKFIGVPDINVQLMGVSLWYVNEQYADVLSAGRVLIGGDAAHRHPPNNGLGSNTCVQDAFNLAWKLAYVIKGYGSRSLLDTYSQERQPVGREVVRRANESRAQFAPLRAIFEKPGRSFDRTLDLLEAPGAEGAALRAEFDAAIELKRYEYQAHGFEMNQRYRSDAVIADDGAAAEVFARDPELYAQPSTRPGAKIPHVWLAQHHGPDRSLLDLVGRGQFTVVTGLAGIDWAEGARRIAVPWLRSLLIGEPGAFDAYGFWRRIREIDEAGVLLVRPDGYVAWRRHGAPASVADAEASLRAAITRILGREP